MIQFTMSSEALLERLQMLSKVLSTKSPTPVLSYFLFRVENNDLMLRASDSELTLTTHLEVQNQGEAGSIAVGQRYMMDFLREIGSQPICFAADAHTFSISITTAQGKFQFMGQSAAEYPEPVKVEADKHSFVVPAASMCTAIQQAQFAMVNDPLRPMFAGLYFDIRPEATHVVSTDGHKLSHITMKDVEVNETAHFLFPFKAVSMFHNLIAKRDDKLTIAFDNNNVLCTLDKYELLCRCIESNFPDYTQVIPSNPPHKAIFDRELLLAAAKRMAICANQSTGLIRLSLSANNLHVSAQDIDFSVSGEEDVNCQYEGDNVEIGFKATMLVELLSSMVASEIVLELVDKTRAGLFEPVVNADNQDVLMLLMPMMI